MNKQESEKYIEQFGSNCYLCGAHVSSVDRRLVQSIVHLKHVRSEHDDPYVFQYYLACAECREGKVLI
jgi:hypothetical protein